MNLIDYYEALRSDIWNVITGTKDADIFCWDETTPNHHTRKWLRVMVLGHYLRQALPFGLYTLSVHEGCDNPNHRDYANAPKELLPIRLGDERYEWIEAFSYIKQFEYCECPCFSLLSKAPFRHYVYETAFFDKDKDTEIPASIGSILSDVAGAIANAGDKMPRSGIREYLLRAIVKIDGEKLKILSKKPALAVVPRRKRYKV